MTDKADPCGSDSSTELGHILAEWCGASHVRFVSRSHGERTTDTVSRDSLIALMRAVRAAERELCASTELDYAAAIKYCYQNLGHAQGTKGCVAFARGAEWALRQLKA